MNMGPADLAAQAVSAATNLAWQPWGLILRLRVKKLWWEQCIYVDHFYKFDLRKHYLADLFRGEGSTPIPPKKSLKPGIFGKKNLHNLLLPLLSPIWSIFNFISRIKDAILALMGEIFLGPKWRNFIKFLNSYIVLVKVWGKFFTRNYSSTHF